MEKIAEPKVLMLDCRKDYSYTDVKEPGRELKTGELARLPINLIDLHSHHELFWGYEEG